MKKLTTFRLDGVLLTEFKAVAVNQGLSMTFLIEKFMKEVVENESIKNTPEYQEEQKRRRIEMKIRKEREESEAEERWKEIEKQVKNGTYVPPEGSKFVPIASADNGINKAIPEDIKAMHKKQKEEEKDFMKNLIGDSPKPIGPKEEEDKEFEQSLKENV